MSTLEYNDSFRVNATLVANEFLDRYMPVANGDYVKVYLFLLRNQVSGIDVATIAENLALTEGDVRRALRYWETQGILVRGKSAPRKAAMSECPEGQAAPMDLSEAETEQDKENPAAGSGAEETRASGQEAALSGGSRTLTEREELRRSYKRTEGARKLDRLAEDKAFTQLLFVVQSYMARILSNHDQQVFAFLYDGLKMPCDVLEYLVEYCVQTGHSSMRYIETVGLDWLDAGIRDVESAKKRTRQFEESRKETSRRKTTRKSQFGTTRDTDYDTVFTDRSSVILDQVFKKQLG